MRNPFLSFACGVRGVGSGGVHSMHVLAAFSFVLYEICGDQSRAEQSKEERLGN
jgi:hypothetical protein